MLEEAVMGGRGVQPGLGQWVGVGRDMRDSRTHYSFL